MFIALGVILSLIFGYLLGSISHGVLIGKIFFGVDVRESGSKNSGGTNTGRVLGKKIGLITIILDMLKCTLSIWITYFICQIDVIQNALVINPSYFGFIAGVGACLGHTFPIFFGFKGGKIVSCFAGIIIATNWLFAICGITFFFIVLKISKYVSLGSIVTALLLGILSFFPVLTSFGMNFGLTNDLYYGILVMCASLFLTYRHKENIKRIINGTESKISWM